MVRITRSSGDRLTSRRPSLWLIAVVLVATVGCTSALEGGSTVPPDAGERETGGGWPDAEPLPDNRERPTVAITLPADGATVEDAFLRVEGTASDDGGLATVFVQIGQNTPALASSDDGYRTWWFEGFAPPGTFEVRAEAFDIATRRSDPAAMVTVTRLVEGSDAAAPSVLIASPQSGTTPLQTVVLLRGSTSDDRGVVRMELVLNGVLQTERRFDTDDGFATWGRLVALESGQENVLTVRAYDAAGNSGSATITLTGRAQEDRVPPSLVVESPTSGARVDTGVLRVSGTASDNLGVREVKLRIGVPSASGCASGVEWGPFERASTEDGYARWSIDVAVHSGLVCVEARAIDVSGLTRSVLVPVTNDYVPEWSPEQLYFMRLRDYSTPPLVRLELDRDGIQEVFNEAIQREIIVAQLDPTGLLTNTLNQIKDACGTCWRNPSGSGCSNNPARYNCALTTLGCSFGDPANGCAGWQRSPEYALVRLLTLTPANADVEGSSLGQLAAVADALNSISFGLVNGFPELLASTLGIGRNSEVVGTNAVVRALLDYLLGTHPGVAYAPGQPDTPLLPISMYDALNDLGPLAVRFGPDAASGHPGILDDSFTPNSVVFPPDQFRMVLDATSNLQWFDGVNLLRGKDYLPIVVDTTGPTFDDIVEFDFNDPARFQVLGLPNNPAVDLRFSIRESPLNVPVCTGSGCRTHLPSAPRAGFVWALDPWLLEPILAASARNQYRTLRTYTSYLGGLARITVGQSSSNSSSNGNPDGWALFQLSGLAQVIAGSPPAEQYVWEMIMDVAEVVGHRNVAPGPSNCPNLPGTPTNESQYTICEGDLQPSFTLFGVPTGVTAAELESQTRSYLQAQRRTLAAMLLGGYEENAGCVDFYYRELDGRRLLISTHPDDNRASTCAPLPAEAGLYADPDLTVRLSTTTIPGVQDVVRQKYELPAGEHVLYTRAAGGGVWRLVVTAPDPSVSDEVTVRVSRRML